MDKLSELRVPPEWEAALVACLDETPPHLRRHRGAWVASLVLAIAGAAGVILWFTH
jgi:hypothetical protein